MVAKVEDDNKLVMTYNNEVVVSISRDFLDTNGSKKYTDVFISKEDKPVLYNNSKNKNINDTLFKMYEDLDFCSQKGLSNIFDSTIGASSVLMPYGGKYQNSKEQVICAKIPVDGKTNTVSLMSYGFDPKLMEKTPYKGSYLSVLSSVSKLIASGASLDSIYLSLQEYFPSVKNDSKRWGNVTSALLGAYQAQMDLKIGAIGGKDSMSGTYENLDVPNTLVSFAVGVTKVNTVKPSLFTKTNSTLILLPIEKDVRNYFLKITEIIQSQNILSSYSLTRGLLLEALSQMSFGNRIGVKIYDNIDIFNAQIGSILIEVDNAEIIKKQLMEKEINYFEIGKTLEKNIFKYKDEEINLLKLENISKNVLEKVYPTNIEQKNCEFKNIDFCKKDIILAKNKLAKPKVVIPVFFGTNCEIDSRRAFEEIGAIVEEVVINTFNSYTLFESTNSFVNKLNDSQILFVPGGFSAADEPEGSAKFISSFLQSDKVKNSINSLMNKRDGLILGICNGFQALVKSGLLPYSQISNVDENSPTLTYNDINQHQSSIVKVRISSTKSPWLMHYNVGDTLLVPISHGEGKFICNDEHLNRLIKNGQIASQYVDFDNNPSMDIMHNPNGSTYAIEAITNEDGRILGRMGHLERCKSDLYKNIGEYKANNLMFKGAISYFR